MPGGDIRQPGELSHPHDSFGIPLEIEARALKTIEYPAPVSQRVAGASAEALLQFPLYLGHMQLDLMRFTDFGSQPVITNASPEP
ncbi:hypothetical protein GCM10027431_23870 [Lysobacter rhizosphaerae]